jgi:glycosyltransferase involved in cell wall biosynthesis
LSQERPLVSVVTPTRFRPQLVCRAVRSALAQTFVDLEVVVVIDGRDPEARAALEAIQDPRLRVVALEQNAGGSEARNIGVREARGKWKALLDDDDEWYPAKIEKQFALAETLPGKRVVVACQYYDTQGETQLLRPRRFPKPISRSAIYCTLLRLCSDLSRALKPLHFVWRRS